MGKSQRDKGASGERAVVKLLTEHGYRAKRTAQLQAGGVEELPGDVTIFGTKDEEWPSDRWIAIEVKRDQAVNLHTKALHSAMEQYGDGIGCVFWKQDRKRWSLSCWAYGQLATFDALLVLEETADLGAWLLDVRGER